MALVDFRDGEREVPDHLALLMTDIDTQTMTYEQAVKAANESMTRWHLTGIQNDVVTKHLKEFPG